MEGTVLMGEQERFYLEAAAAYSVHLQRDANHSRVNREVGSWYKKTRKRWGQSVPGIGGTKCSV